MAETRGGPAPLLTLSGIAKTFGRHRAVDGVSLDLERGEFVCLLGPSGCGKSTLMRLIAGLEMPDAGTIQLDGEDVTGRPPHRRSVNMMFQSYALFPHMSVERNIAYGLHGLGLSRAAIGTRVDALSRMLRLEGFSARRPQQLSGGQRQRVALARSLAREPKLLLLDEPLGALDRSLREETQGELRALQRRLGTGFVVVTHDPDEAMALADRIGVMADGRLVQLGTARDLYERPADRFVAGILGDVNLIAGRLGPRGDAGTRIAQTALGPIHGIPAEALASAAADTPIVVAIRPEHFGPGVSDGPAGATALTGTLVDTAFLGDRVRRQVRMGDGTVLRMVQAVSEEGGAEAVGAPVRLVLAPNAARLLPA